MAYADLSNKKLRFEIYNKYDQRCAYCGIKFNSISELNIDHIIPIRRKMLDCVKGENIKENLNPACVCCNSSKSSLDLEEWRLRLYGLQCKFRDEIPMYKIALRLKILTENYNTIFFYFERVKNV